jgi:hypothetical protein
MGKDELDIKDVESIPSRRKETREKERNNRIIAVNPKT